MKLIILVLTIFTFFDGFSQELTISETIDYLNSKTENNPKLELNDEGRLSLTYYKNSPNLGMLAYKKYESFINDLRVSNLGYIESSPYSRFEIGLNCVFDKPGCISIKTGDANGNFPTGSSNGIMSKCEFDETFIREDNEKKINAFKYLISLANNEIKFQKIDNDPFSNKNFENSLNVVSTNTKSNKIQLTSENGVYKIWVEVLGIKENFVLDTGASEISLSQIVEKDLISKKLLKKEDYLDPALFKIADGSIILCRRVKLKQIKVGNVIVKNVIASIGISEAPLLLGKSFLDKFQKWSIDNKTKMLILEN